MTTARVVYGMPEAAYRAERMLSYSTAKLLLGSSPMHADKSFREPPRKTTAMEKGTLFDELMTDGGRIVELDYLDYKTAAARTDRDAALASGLVPALRHKLLAAREAADDLAQQLESLGVPRGEHSQVSLFWEELSSCGRVVRCRGRLDWLSLPVIVDLKTIASADDESCRKAITEHGYDIQAAAYLRGAERAFPEWAGRLRFIDAFMETATRMPNPLEPDPELLAMGAQKWQLAVDIWASCEASGEWPGYSTGVRRVSAPGYALSRHANRMAEASEKATEEW